MNKINWEFFRAISDTTKVISWQSDAGSNNWNVYCPEKVFINYNLVFAISALNSEKHEDLYWQYGLLAAEPFSPADLIHSTWGQVKSYIFTLLSKYERGEMSL